MTFLKTMHIRLSLPVHTHLHPQKFAVALWRSAAEEILDFNGESTSERANMVRDYKPHVRSSLIRRRRRMGPEAATTHCSHNYTLQHCHASRTGPSCTACLVAYEVDHSAKPSEKRRVSALLRMAKSKLAFTAMIGCSLTQPGWE